MIRNVLMLSLFLFFGCKHENVVDANAIINQSIEISGGDFIKNSIIEFDFRDTHYRAIRKENKFILERSFTEKPIQNSDSIINITDALSNKGFMRLVNNFPMAVLDSMAVKYSASVNSVHYFSVLPYGLNDKAVNKTYLGDVTIKEKQYHKIKVTFDEAGGGEDFEDVFIYWVNSESFKVDFLAYSYAEEDGIGLRFREAFNERYIKGIRFVDYNNFKPKDDYARLENLDILFEKDSLISLSKIELENILVN